MIVDEPINNPLITKKTIIAGESYPAKITLNNCSVIPELFSGLYTPKNLDTECPDSTQNAAINRILSNIPDANPSFSN